MTWNSVNDGDVFILDVGQGLIQWNAPKSNRQEKLKAAELARNIRGNGLARVNIESYCSTIQTCRLLKNSSATCHEFLTFELYHTRLDVVRTT